jgi:hypothetical protein
VGSIGQEPAQWTANDMKDNPLGTATDRAAIAKACLLLQ